MDKWSKFDREARRRMEESRLIREQGEKAAQIAKEAVKEFLEEARDRTYGVTIRACPHCGKEI